MSMELDSHELGDRSARFLQVAQQKFPRDTRNFMGRAGNKLSSKAKKSYRAETKKKTGNLLKGVKRGKPYKYSSNEYSVRVENKAPHAHLIEYGHAEWAHHAKKHNFEHAKPTGRYVKGQHIMGKATKEFEGEFGELAEGFIDRMISEGKL